MAGWTDPVRNGIVTVAAAIVLAVASLTFATLSGHADADDLAEVAEEAARIEHESRERDEAIKRQLYEHLKAAQIEAVKQAQFRGAVAQALKIKLPEE